MLGAEEGAIMSEADELFVQSMMEQQALMQQIHELDATRRYAQAEGTKLVEEKRRLEGLVKDLESRRRFGSCEKCLTDAWRICTQGAPDAVEMKCSNGSIWWHCDYCASKADLTRLRTLVRDVVDHFEGDFENPGFELYGLVNGREIANGGRLLNELLDRARHTLGASATPTKEPHDHEDDGQTVTDPSRQAGADPA